MMMKDEFTVWREHWQSAPPVPIHLIQRVERQTARMRMLRLAEIVVTIVIGGAVLAGAIVRPWPDLIDWTTLAAGTWLFIAALWAVSARSTRHGWDAAEQTTAAYVSLQIQRLRRESERVVLGTVVSVLLSVFVLFVAFTGLVRALASRGAHLGTADVAVFCIVGGVVNVFVILAQFGKHRRAREELAKMMELERTFEPLSGESAS
jgi:hypothetical protein